MDRPRLKIRLEPIDLALELLGFLGLILFIGLPLYFYDELPESIPRHFGANGEPDGFSGKEIIWTLPIIGIVLYLGLFWINKYPHFFNYAQQVTKENAEDLYRSGTRMIRSLKVISICIFAYICYSTIQTALNNQSGLGYLTTATIMVLILGTSGYFIFRMVSRTWRKAVDT